MTSTHTIRCGNCRSPHRSVEEVKACTFGVAGGPAANPDLVEAYSKAYVHEDEAPATEKQLAFIERLLSERPSFTLETPVTTKRNASRLIDKLLGMPKEVNQDAGGNNSLIALLRNVPDGYYALQSKTGNNDFDFIVVRTKDTRRYINRYLGGQGQVHISGTEQRAFAQMLTSFSPATLALIRQLFGKLLGHCGICGRSLTDETSRARGIGPDCWSRL